MIYIGVYIVAIVKKPISEQIYEELKNEILCNRIGFGEKLANRDLQKRFGVSSTPIRDAINHLYLDGFVDEITNVGAHVVNFDLTSAQELNEIVSLLSVEAVRLSAEKSERKEVVNALKKQILYQKKSNSNEKYFKYDNKFHRTFFEYSLNSRFSRLYDQCNVLQEVIIRYYYKTMNADKKYSIVEHEKMCYAYEAGDIAKAQMYMAEHYARALDRIEELLK